MEFDARLLASEWSIGDVRLLCLQGASAYVFAGASASVAFSRRPTCSPVSGHSGLCGGRYQRQEVVFTRPRTIRDIRLVTAPPLVEPHLESGIDLTVVDFGGAGQVLRASTNLCALQETGQPLKADPNSRFRSSAGYSPGQAADQETGGAAVAARLDEGDARPTSGMAGPDATDDATAQLPSSIRWQEIECR
jgi:hypothetical protein